MGVADRADVGSALWVLDGETRLPADAERRHALRAKLAAGELDELVFEACRVSGGVSEPELPAVSGRGSRSVRRELRQASRSCGITTPGSCDARGGTVRASWLGRAASLMQRIALTVPRDIEAFLNQTIDRFSIGWYWTPPLCSVCGNEWLSRECNHWPGRKYGGRSSDGMVASVRCCASWCS